MYRIKHCHNDLDLEEFIKETNENDYKIIDRTVFKDKMNILYEIEEKKKSNKRTKQAKAEEEKENEDTMKEGE